MSKKCPPAGSGRVNSWTWATACEGKRLGWPPEKVSQYLRENTRHSGDEADYEIDRAVSRVFQPREHQLPIKSRCEMMP